MHRRLTTHKHLLKALHTLKPKYQRALLKTCDEEEINCICESIHNKQGKVPLKDQDKQKLNKHKNILRKLVRDRQPLRLPIYSDTLNEDSNKSKIGFKNKDRDLKTTVDAESMLEENRSIESKENDENPLYTPAQILSLIPKAYNKKGQLLLNLVETSKSKIHWDNEGTVIIDNEKIPGSNIIDLINDSLKPLKRSDPVGWDRFAEALKDTKVPLTYIGNPKRCEFINQLQAKDLKKPSEIDVHEFFYTE
ncbi:unnamed protein product [Parnassius apollo]|uniref:(apollo) hypothetical protein n=1 Tax=Parnassius apollo TaxID=110799 RepID=A0A8S3XE19_PARAO|nr:unnamed protein product [Parnassius apollo]